MKTPSVFCKCLKDKHGIDLKKIRDPTPLQNFLFLSCVNGPWHENVAVTKYVSCDTSRYASVVD